MHRCREGRCCAVRHSTFTFESELTIERVNYDRASIFSNKSDERVMHDDSGSEGEQLDQKYKRPDRVYGLGVTSSFLPFRERFKKYSPFTGHHTLFPFLLFEAKSEKSGQGFEQIENQTALSIRTFLKLQIDLEHDSNQILDPVVWFFGSKGEEWRLYLACMVGDATVGDKSMSLKIMGLPKIAEGGRLLARIYSEC